MATVKENLITTRENLAASMASESGNPKPTYFIDGQKVSWNEWWEVQTANMVRLKEMIDAEDDDDITEIQTQAIT